MSSKRGAKRHKKKTRRHRKVPSRPPKSKVVGPSVLPERERPEKTKPARPELVTGRRLWLFRVVAVTVVPVLLLLLVELSLRVVGYGYDAGALLKCEFEGEDAYCDNLKFTRQFFPKNIARHFEPFVFPAVKRAGTYRIFVLGASAARGEPDPSFCFSRMLRLMLQDQYPTVKFEVINTAVVAINSHVVLEIAKDCARHDADLFIVYLGNNEVTGPYGAGTVYTPPSANLPVIRMGIALKATRLGQLLASLIGSVRTVKSAPKVWRGLEMFLENQVPADSPDLEAVYRNYEKNLRDISRVARRGGAKILFSTVGANLKDSPPFASLHRPDLTETQLKQWDGIYALGVEHESAGDYGEAIEFYLAAAKIDDRYADLQFRLGRCWRAKGEYDHARDSYIMALDLDTLRFRADTRINSIIREVAGNRTKEGVYLADAARAFKDSSDHETPGDELFYEHVHLNFEGTYLLAGTIFEQVQKIVPQQWVKRRAVGESAVLSQTDCAERLAYTDWDKHVSADRILNGFIRKPPFTNQLYHQQRMTRMSRDVESLKSNLTARILAVAADQYRGAIEQAPRDWRLHWKYGKLLAEGLRDYRAAAEQFRLVGKLVPHSHLGHTAMGAVLRGLGDYESMIAEYLQAIRLNPESADSHYYVGWGYRKQGRTDLAERYYRQTIRLQPDYVPACNDLAEILYSKGELDEAIATYRRGLIFSPDSPILHGNLGMMLSKQGHTDEAIRELRTALELDPGSAKIRRMLESVSRTQN